MINVKLRRLLTREHISYDIPKLMYVVMLVTHSVNIHVNNPSVNVRFNNPSLQKIYDRNSAKRPGVSLDRNHRINSVDLVCVVLCEDHKF